MKAGRVIDGDEHDARTLATRLVADARTEAEQIRETAKSEAAHLHTDVKALAASILADARSEAERTLATAQAEAAKLRDSAASLANELVRGARDTVHADDTAAQSIVTHEHGRVDEVVGLVVRATVPGVALGELVRVERRGQPLLPAEVVGFRGE